MQRNSTVERIPLPLLPLELARLTGEPGPTYRTCYLAAVDGQIPAERGLNGRWTVAARDLAKVAAAFRRDLASAPSAS
jgi:hypothetical protein